VIALGRFDFFVFRGEVGISLSAKEETTLLRFGFFLVLLHAFQGFEKAVLLLFLCLQLIIIICILAELR
jgi:hypothetical protein